MPLCFFNLLRTGGTADLRRRIFLQECATARVTCAYAVYSTDACVCVTRVRSGSTEGEDKGEDLHQGEGGVGGWVGGILPLRTCPLAPQRLLFSFSPSLSPLSPHFLSARSIHTAGLRARKLVIHHHRRPPAPARSSLAHAGKCEHPTQLRRHFHPQQADATPERPTPRIAHI